MVCASEIPECLQILPSLVRVSNVSAVFSSAPGFSRQFLIRFWTPPALETRPPGRDRLEKSSFNSPRQKSGLLTPPPFLDSSELFKVCQVVKTKNWKTPLQRGIKWTLPLRVAVYDSLGYLLSGVITCRLGCLHNRVLFFLRSLRLRWCWILSPVWGSLERGLEVGDERNDVVVAATQSGYIGVPWNNHLRHVWLTWLYKWQVKILQTFFKADILPVYFMSAPWHLHHASHLKTYKEGFTGTVMARRQTWLDLKSE